MVSRRGGTRRKTRSLMTKERRTRGKISLRRYFQPYKVGEMVHLVGEPAVQDAMFHPRYWGKQGVIEKKRGKCYEVTIKDRSQRKRFVVHPIHLRKI